MKPSPSLLLQLALLGSLALPASAADLYWNRTTTAAWTTSNWGTVSGGPYTSAWVSGSDVIFEDNSGTPLLITGATTNVASITANENVTVTAGGTLTLAGPINVADGKTLNFGTQVLSGSGIEKTGLGNLDLNANNSFTGGFAIRGGNMFVRNANALGGESVTLGATSGSDFAELRATSAVSLANPIVLAEGTTGTLSISNLGAGAKPTYTGGVTGTNNLRIRTVIGGSGESKVTMNTGDINHVGTLTLANTGTGSSTNAQGLIDIRSSITANVTSLTISNETTGTRGVQRVFMGNTNNAYTGDTIINAGAHLVISISDVIPDGAGKGDVAVGGILEMRGATETINGLSGTGTIRRGSNTDTSTLRVGANNATASFGGTIENGTGTMALTKTGSGTQTITATSTTTYTGETKVDQGTLVINGNISTSSLTTVASGAYLGGDGTVGALTVNSGGFVTPGNSPGILTVDGDYTQAGTYTAEVTGTTAGVGGYDQIGVSGSVDITGGSLTTIFSGSGYAAGNLLFILLNDGTDAITGTYTGFAQGDVVATYGGLDWIISYNADSASNTFTGALNGNDIALYAIPEPSAALLGGMGILLLLRRRR